MSLKRRCGYVYRLIPSPSQAMKLARFAGMARYVYNRALTLQNEQYKLLGKQDSVYTLKKLLPRWKMEAATQWLGEAPSQGLQTSFLNLGNAWKRYFDPKRPDAQKPTLRKRSKHCAYQFPQGFKVEAEQSRIWLPKLGWISYVNSCDVQGTVRCVTVRRRCGRWLVTLLAEREVEQPALRRDKWVGLDLGIACHTATSDGNQWYASKTLRRAVKRLARLQSHRDRKMQQGSKSYAHESRKIAQLHQHIANIRQDTLHQRSTQLVKTHDVVCVEDLQVKHMSKSAKGSVEKPGKCVAAKRGLNREILSQGWFELRRQLTYKASWSGGMVVAVNPRYTSQRCSACLAVDRQSRKTQARFVCTACGHEMHADINAAKNILAAGLAVTALGALGNSQAQNSEECTAA